MTEDRPARRRPATKWIHSPPPDEAQATALAAALNIPMPAARLLVGRGHLTADGAKRYLRPQLEHLHDPALVMDMAVAVDRLSRAIKAGETILVHGDYDVDGICSTALMTRAIRSLGGKAVPFIPDRLRDGYDLGPAGVAAAREAGAKVVLTCDCGTTAVDAARALKAAGIDLIITDHHLPGPVLPDAIAVLNPRRAGDDSPDKDLAAVGVAFKLALSLTRAMHGNQNVVLNMLDLVALATVADVAPLRGENRVFVRRGLAVMGETKCVGLRALIRAAGLEGREITAGRVGFILGPRLNALGRMDKALLGVELLLCESEDRAMEIARYCEERNRERQETDRRILDQALERVEQLDLDAVWGIVLSDPEWHAGVIGIVASRLVEATARPVFLIAVQDGIGKGSGRSIPAFDLHGAIVECGPLLMKYGGHRAAAGLTVDAERIPELAERFNSVARAKLKAEDLVRAVHVDLELPLEQASEELEKVIRRFEPCGIGNPGPVFAARGVQLASGAQRIGSDGIKVFIGAPAGAIEAVGWGLAHRAEDLVQGARVDIAYRLELNTYRGSSRLQLSILDFRPAA